MSFRILISTGSIKTVLINRENHYAIGCIGSPYSFELIKSTPIRRELLSPLFTKMFFVKAVMPAPSFYYK
jgi:hypothetical protein